MPQKRFEEQLVKGKEAIIDKDKNELWHDTRIMFLHSLGADSEGFQWSIERTWSLLEVRHKVPVVTPLSWFPSNMDDSGLEQIGLVYFPRIVLLCNSFTAVQSWYDTGINYSE